MKASTGILIFLVFCLVTLILGRVFDGPTESEPSPDPKPAASTPAKSPEQIRAEKTRLAKLQKDFVITTDEFTGIKTYRHKAFSRYMDGNGTTLEAQIEAKGTSKTLYVESQFVSDDWIFHDAYELKTKKTQPVIFTGTTRREVLNGGICELVSSTAESSVGIALLIAAADASHEPIRVRLDGKFTYDYTLKPAFERASAETFELYSLMDSN